MTNQSLQKIKANVLKDTWPKSQRKTRNGLNIGEYMYLIQKNLMICYCCLCFTISDKGLVTMYIIVDFSEWIDSLSKESIDAFLRAVNLGVELNEAWVVCSSASYIWNYNNHTMTQLRHREMVETLKEVLTGMKKVGHAG